MAMCLDDSSWCNEALFTPYTFTPCFLVVATHHIVSHFYLPAPHGLPVPGYEQKNMSPFLHAPSFGNGGLCFCFLFDMHIDGLLTSNNTLHVIRTSSTRCASTLAHLRHPMSSTGRLAFLKHEAARSCAVCFARLRARKRSSWETSPR